MFANAWKSTRLVLLGGAMTVTAVAGTGCKSDGDGGGSGGGGSISVPLIYSPRTSDAPPMSSVPNRSNYKIQVVPSEDKRDAGDRNTIGQNTQKAAIPVVGTGGTLGDVVAKGVKQTVRDSGLGVTDDMSVCTHQLLSEIIQFQSNEAGTYKSEVTIKYKLVDKAGKTVYEMEHAGSGANWGSSKKAENYQQTYSDAIRRSAIKLVSDPEFARALTTSAGN